MTPILPYQGGEDEGPRVTRSPYETGVLTYTGAVLRAARQRKGWALREFAAELARRNVIVLQHTTLGQIERGEIATPCSTLAYLAEVLEIPVSLLFPPREVTLHELVARRVLVADTQVVQVIDGLLAVTACDRQRHQKGARVGVD